MNWRFRCVAPMLVSQSGRVPILPKTRGPGPVRDGSLWSLVTGHFAPPLPYIPAHIDATLENGRIPPGGDTVSTEAVASRRHAGGQPPVIGWKLELPITTWHLLLN